VRYLLLPFLLFGFFASAKQEVSVQNVVCSAVRHADVSCLQVRFDLSFTETYVDVLKRGDTADMYFIEVRLIAAHGFVNANKGFSVFADSLGQVVGVLRLPLSDIDKRYVAQVVHLPLAALVLAVGPHNLQPELRVIDRWGRSLGKRWTLPTFLHNQPQLLRLNINVQSILVDSLNLKGETWDHPGGGVQKTLPDLMWTILFMQKKLSVAATSHNTLRYIDTQSLNDVEFTIAQDDAFSIGVYDYDMPTFSDRIGQVKVDMNDMQKFSGSVFTASSGKVRMIEFTVTIL
jgi:hypothetical protein